MAAQAARAAAETGAIVGRLGAPSEEILTVVKDLAQETAKATEGISQRLNRRAGLSRPRTLVRAGRN